MPLVWLFVIYAATHPHTHILSPNLQSSRCAGSQTRYKLHGDQSDCTTAAHDNVEVHAKEALGAMLNKFIEHRSLQITMVHLLNIPQVMKPHMNHSQRGDGSISPAVFTVESLRDEIAPVHSARVTMHGMALDEVAAPFVNTMHHHADNRI